MMEIQGFQTLIRNTNYVSQDKHYSNINYVSDSNSTQVKNQSDIPRNRPQSSTNIRWRMNPLSNKTYSNIDLTSRIQKNPKKEKCKRKIKIRDQNRRTSSTTKHNYLQEKKKYRINPSLISKFSDENQNNYIRYQNQDVIYKNQNLSSVTFQKKPTIYGSNDEIIKDNRQNQQLISHDNPEIFSTNPSKSYTGHTFSLFPSCRDIISECDFFKCQVEVLFEQEHERLLLFGLSPKKRVLDIGSGCGYWIKKMLEKANNKWSSNIWLLERDEALCKLASKKILNEYGSFVRILNADVLRLSLIHI